MKRAILTLLLALSVLLAWSSPAEGQSPTTNDRGAAAFPDKSNARIVISQDDQQMFIYEGEQLVRALPVSTGWPGVRKTTTPTWSGRIGGYWGTFTSFGTTQDDGFWLFTDYLEDGSWNGDILLHGAPYQLSPTGQKEYERYGIGQEPVSNGCIRLQPEDAQWLREWDPIGVAITILPLTRDPLAYPKLGLGAQLIATVQNAAQGSAHPAR